MCLCMKYLLCILGVIIPGLCFGFASNPDTSSDTYTDSSDIYLSKDDLKQYFRTVANHTISLADSAKTDGKVTVEELSLVKASASRLLNYPRNLNADERKAMRLACMQVGYRIAERLSNKELGLTYLLRSHAFVDDDECLDSFSWFIENWISTIYMQLGDYDKAIAFGLKTEKSLLYYDMPERLTRLYTNLGDAYYWKKDYTGAERYYHKGLAMAESLNYKKGICANLTKIGGLRIIQGQHAQAEELIQDARQVLMTIPDDPDSLDRKSTFSNMLGKIRTKQNRYREALSFYQSSIEYLTKYHKVTQRREFAKEYIAIAEIHLMQDSLDAAGHAIQMGLSSILPEYDHDRELPDAHLVYRENSFIDLFKLKATFYQRKADQGIESIRNWEMAFQSLELAIKANDQLRENFVADPSKLLSIEENKNLIDQGITLAFHLYEQNHDLYYVRKAREYFSRSKSLLLDAKIKANTINHLLTLQDKEDLERIEYQIIEFYNQRTTNQSESTSNQSIILALLEQRSAILSKYKPHQRRKPIPNDYIEYNVQDKYIYALSRIGRQLKFLRIGKRSELINMLTQLNDYILYKGLENEETIPALLFSFLVRPVTENLPAKITIIPDREISFIPFELLRGKEHHFAIEQSTISYAFQYESLSSGKSKNANSKVFCLAPNYSKDKDHTMEMERGSIFHLPHVQQETDAIRKVFEKDFSLSTGAAKPELLRQLRDCKIFHYAGHAIVNKDSAYLALEENGVITPLTDQEIALLYNPLAMVVLSACETGLGKLEYGEGIRSLGKSFMEAGAEASIYSLWTVNDKSTADIMGRFYYYLKQGKRKDEALHLAKIEFIKQSKEVYTHPYYWAGFIAVGKMDKLNGGNLPLQLMIPLGGTLFLFSLVYLLRKKKSMVLII